jgi:RNase P subunit RPR2
MEHVFPMTVRNDHEERLARLEEIVQAIQNEIEAIKRGTAKMIDAVQVKLGRDARPPVCHMCGSANIEVRDFPTPSPETQWLVCRVCAHSRTIPKMA